jgi:hypothetical protein
MSLRVWTALCVSIAFVGSACARRLEHSAPDMWATRVALMLDSGRSNNGRAGLRPARSSNGEFGIVVGARVSPDGRWITVADAVPPHVKIVDESGVATATIPGRSTGATRHTAIPVIATSNTGVLLVWPDVRQVELYDFAGKLRKSGAHIDFLPISATAISDSEWVVYGPSDRRLDGRASWVHCLQFGGQTAPRWNSAFMDFVDSTSSAMTNVTVPYVTGDSVVIEHRQRHGAVMVSVDCGGVRKDPTVFVSARALAPGGEPSRRRQEAAAASFRVMAETGGAGLLRADGAYWIVATDDAPSISFQPVTSATPVAALRVQGDYRIMDSRAGLGVLFANDARMPVLFIAPDDALRAALSGFVGSTRAASRR